MRRKACYLPGTIRAGCVLGRSNGDNSVLTRRESLQAGIAGCFPENIKIQPLLHLQWTFSRTLWKAAPEFSFTCKTLSSYVIPEGTAKLSSHLSPCFLLDATNTFLTSSNPLGHTAQLSPPHCPCNRQLPQHIVHPGTCALCDGHFGLTTTHPA